ncbi:uncharacterized protein PFL1_06370 [Pseudozyma flocculosa PF-1]|uniref:Ubiquitin-like protease family profile domain-containing protein n=1 Tax=Pseudozyma flocculosa PF-1 TaxID=1277687 RepID=A0A061H114_9BASI|nr:uncharacterized protein PFL1_06370 [Pseudozyma flocculosa PF-1]EPQ26162.1 hypothetical protein PFL1_06370 [Pseudozyma flocculosa PF-1]
MPSGAGGGFGRRGAGHGDMYKTGHERGKMSTLHGNPSSGKQRTKITAPPVGATAPEPSTPSRTGNRIQKPGEFDPKAGKGNRHSSAVKFPYGQIGQDNLYPDESAAGPARRNQATRAPATLNLNHGSSRIHEGPAARQGVVGGHVRHYEAINSSSYPTNGAGSRHHAPAATSNETTYYLSSSNDEEQATQATPAEKKHIRFPSPEVEVVSPSDSRPAPTKSSPWEINPALQRKDARRHDEQQKKDGAEAGPSYHVGQRPNGPIQLETSDEPGKTSADPIVVGSQDTREDPGARKGSKRRERDAPYITAAAAASSSATLRAGQLAPISSSIPTGKAARMRPRSAGRSPDMEKAATTSPSRQRNAAKRGQGIVGTAVSDDHDRARPSHVQGVIRTLRLQSFTISDVWRSHPENNDLELVDHRFKLVITQKSSQRQLTISKDDIALVKRSEPFAYRHPVAQLQLKPGSQTLKTIAKFWPEFDPKAISDAAGIILVPLLEQQQEGVWDELLESWDSQPHVEVHELDKNAAKTMTEIASQPSPARWPQPSEGSPTSGSLKGAGQLASAISGSIKRPRQAITPGENRQDFSESPPRQAPREPNGRLQRSEKTFNLTNGEARQEARVDGAPRSSHAAASASATVSGRSARSQQHKASPTGGASVLASAPEPPAKKPERSGNEQVLRFPYEGIGAVTLLESDLDRLNDGEFLNDTLIEFGLKRLLDGIRQRQPALADQIHVFSSFFYKRLTEFEVSKSYLNVRKWTNKFDLFSKRYIVVPINEDFHWYLAIIVNPHYMTKPAPPPPPRPEPKVTRSNRGRIPDSESDDTPALESRRPRVADARRLNHPGDTEETFKYSDATAVARQLLQPKEGSSGDDGDCDRRHGPSAGGVESDAIMTPPPPASGPASSIDLKSPFRSGGKHSRQASGHSELAAPAASSSAREPSPTRGKKRDAHGDVKAASLAETAQGVDVGSSLERLSLSPPSNPRPPSTNRIVPVIDQRPGNLHPTEHKAMDDQASTRSSSSDDTVATAVDAAPDAHEAQGPTGFSMLEDEGERVSRADYGDRTGTLPRSGDAMQEDSMEGFGYDDDDDDDTEFINPVGPRDAPVDMDVDVDDSQDRSTMLDASARTLPRKRSSIPRRHFGHTLERRGTSSTDGEADAEATGGTDANSGFSLLDEQGDRKGGPDWSLLDHVRDPQRGSRVGGGPAVPSASPERPAAKPSSPTKIVPGAGRTVSPPPEPVNETTGRPHKAARTTNDTAYRPTSTSASTGNSKTYSSRHRPAPASGLANGSRSPSMPARTASTGADLNLEQTVIITFDSLMFARPDVKKNLRAYLFLEAQDKGKLEDAGTTLDKAPQPCYVKAIVPKQPNYADCGIYLLHYFDRFFSDPPAFLQLVMTKSRVERKEWEPERVSGKRDHWKAEIRRLGEDWKQWKARKDEEQKRLKSEAEDKARKVADETGAAAATATEGGADAAKLVQPTATTATTVATSASPKASPPPVSTEEAQKQQQQQQREGSHEQRPTRAGDPSEADNKLSTRTSAPAENEARQPDAPSSSLTTTGSGPASPIGSFGDEEVGAAATPIPPTPRLTATTGSTPRRSKRLSGDGGGSSKAKTKTKAKTTAINTVDEAIVIQDSEDEE